MAQTRYYEYKADDSTDSLNRRDIGFFQPGVYKGFDVKFADTTGTDLVLYHEETGYTDVNVAQTESSPKGMLKTRQGTIVVEDAEITIGASEGMTGNAVANPRIDVVYLEHARVETTGGVSAGYGVKAGTAAATPSIPALDTPELQIPIAYVYWPASTSDLSAAGVKIVRTGVAVVTDYQQPRLQEMTYDATAKTLNSQYRSNWYYIANIDADYKEIDGITLHGFNPTPEVIQVFTKQRLWIDSTGDFNVRSRVSGRTLIEAGELLTFIRSTEVDIPASGFYVLVRGDEVRRDSKQKITGQLITNRGTATVNAANGEITLNGDGNLYQLDVDFATITNSELTALTSFASFWDGTNTQTEDGAMVVLRIVNTGASATLTLVDGATPSGSTFSAFETGSADSLVTDDTYLLLIENNGVWHVLLNQSAGATNWTDAGTSITVVTDTGSATIAGSDVVYNKFRLHNGTMDWHLVLDGFDITGTPGAIQFPIPTIVSDLGLEIASKGLVQIAGVFNRSSTRAAVTADLGKLIAGTDGGGYITVRRLDASNFSTGTAEELCLSVTCELMKTP